MDALEIVSGWSERGTPYAMMSDGSVWYWDYSAEGRGAWERDTHPLPDAAFRPIPSPSKGAPK
jgi:hypothetical protein